MPCSSGSSIVKCGQCGHTFDPRRGGDWRRRLCPQCTEES